MQENTRSDFSRIEQRIEKLSHEYPNLAAAINDLYRRIRTIPDEQKKFRALIHLDRILSICLS